MDISSVTEKGQATIPVAIRQYLALSKGDKVGFDIDDSGKVIVQKIEPLDRAYLSAVEQSLAEEWLSPEDCKAYDHL